MRTEAPLRNIPLGPNASIGDFQRYPGCRLAITCAMCGFTKDYDPQRVIGRLQALKAGGATAPMAEIARRVQWPCPRCHRLRWRVGLAWPPDAYEARRIAARERN